MVQSLLEDPRRRFLEVEMKFFKMWWDLQTEEMKKDVRGLVNSGQLELVNGGWSMHDEACPTYEDMINNMQFGHDFILSEFGVKPTIGWQIDPFGHSNTNARFYAEMGFDALFLGRIDYQDKNRRMDDLEMEFVWRPYSKQGANGKDYSDSQIFTHVLWDGYGAPEGFGFDILDDDDPWINDEESEDYNAPQEA